MTFPRHWFEQWWGEHHHARLCMIWDRAVARAWTEHTTNRLLDECPPGRTCNLHLSQSRQNRRWILNRRISALNPACWATAVSWLHREGPKGPIRGRSELVQGRANRGERQAGEGPSPGLACIFKSTIQTGDPEQVGRLGQKQNSAAQFAEGGEKKKKKQAI